MVKGDGTCNPDLQLEEEKSGPLGVGGKIKIPRIAAIRAFVDVGLRDLESSFDFAGEAYYVIHITH